jgi:PAS domain S-box-containing protein
VTKPEELAAQSDIAALAIAEQRYRALVRATSSLVWVTAADGQIADMPEWRAYTGESVEQIKGWGWLNSLHPDDRERTAVVWQRAVDARSFYETDYRIRRNDGIYVWHRARGVPVLEADGSIREWVGICLDITRRRQTEEKRIEAETALRRLNETLEQRIADALAEKKVYADIVENSTAAVTALDLDWRILAINRANAEAFERVYGKRPAVGDDFLSLFDDAPEYVEQQRAIWSRALQGETFMVVQDFGNARIERRTYEVRFNPLLNGKGERIGASSTSYDVTDRVLAEAQLAAAQAQLAYANRLETMLQLTASIAHEVNQPIAATVTNAEAALRFLSARPPNLDEVRDALDWIVRDGSRAGAVVSRIRNLIKKAPPSDERADINAAIREVIELTRSEAMKNGVPVRTELVEGLPLVQGDRVELQQVILNLILNAVEAMSELSEGSRELLITTGKTESGDVLVAVRDSGPGLAPAALEHLFKAFHTTKPSGLGLGLSICRSIVEAHGGRLWADANEPRGAVFQFTLPGKEKELMNSLPAACQTGAT